MHSKHSNTSCRRAFSMIHRKKKRTTVRISYISHKYRPQVRQYPPMIEYVQKQSSRVQQRVRGNENETVYKFDDKRSEYAPAIKCSAKLSPSGNGLRRFSIKTSFHCRFSTATAILSKNPHTRLHSRSSLFHLPTPNPLFNAHLSRGKLTKQSGSFEPSDFFCLSRRNRVP